MKMAEYNNPVRTTTTLLGITSTFLLSGINIGTSLLFVPHLYTLPIETSTRIFDSLYHDGAKAVVPLAATSILSYSYLAYHHASAAAATTTTNSINGQSTAMAVAAGLVVSTLAWTQLVVMPVNNRLVSIARKGASGKVGGGEKVGGGGTSEVEGLLASWRWMNYVRGFLALTAGLVALHTVV